MNAIILEELRNISKNKWDSITLYKKDSEILIIQNPVFISHSSRCNFSVRSIYSKDYKCYHIIKDGELLCTHVECKRDDGSMICFSDMEKLLESTNIHESVDTIEFRFYNLIQILIEERDYMHNISILNKLKKNYPKTPGVQTANTQDHSISKIPDNKIVKFMKYEIIEGYPEVLNLISQEDVESLDNINSKLYSLRSHIEKIRFESRLLMYLLDLEDSILPWTNQKEGKKSSCDLRVGEFLIRKTVWSEKI